MRTFVLFVALSGAVLSSADGLHIGDDAPPLKVDRWMKGSAIPKFELGKVYVVEFWATWCGPCRQAMPHLSELAKKYEGKATFIGVDIWEDQHAGPGEDLKAKANKFVIQMGSRMGYNVCAGSDDGYMTDHWMNAAGQGGIPATFVIGKTSKVEWIGHPDYLAEPLAQIIDDKFDAKAFADKTNPGIDKERAQAALAGGINKPVEAALKAKNYELAISECNKAIATCPPIYKFGLAMTKFQTITKHMPDRAYAEAQKIEGDPDQTWMASEVFASTSGLDKKCYLFAMDFFRKKYEPQPSNHMAQAHYADVYYQLGEFPKAVEMYQQFIDAMKKQKLDPVTMAGFEKQLQKFKKAASQGSSGQRD